MKLFRVDVHKTVQAVAVLLRTLGRRNLEYLSLLKMLYIADRESWAEAGSPITGDAPVAMRNGPVLSGVYDLINRNTERGLALWTEYIHKEEYDLELKADPGVDRLSLFEVGKLEEVARRYAGCTWRELIQITHDLPEWQKNNPEEHGVNVKPIPLDDVLAAVGRAEDAEWIKQETAAALAMAQALGQ